MDGWKAGYQAAGCQDDDDNEHEYPKKNNVAGRADLSHKRGMKRVQR